jgi:hypothetical protein
VIFATIKNLAVKNLIQSFAWRSFSFFEKFGLHVLPVHYYSPIPDTQTLRKNMGLFSQEDPLHGLDMNEGAQMEILHNVIYPFEQEYIQAGEGNFGISESQMPSFAPINALTLYSFIRHYKPRKMIEVGSGMSTQISAAAFARNKENGIEGFFTAIEPYPADNLKKGFEGLSELMVTKVEDVAEGRFKQLQANDILFIDSSHTVKIFGDVNYLFLNILPQLNPGVIIHIHDIFFPYNYPPHHFLEPKIKQIWQEQYLLQAFLAFNGEFEIKFCSSYMHAKELNKLKELFPWYHEKRIPSSIWIQRKEDVR